MWCVLMQAAWAGPVLQVHGGAGATVQAESEEPHAGPMLGVVGGYRVEVGPVALQPEAAFRANLGVGTMAVGLGAEAAIGLAGPLWLGPYAHLGVGIAGYPLPSSDAGLSLYADLPSPLVVGLRAGWQWDRPTRYKCGDCAQPAEHWLVAVGTVGVAF
jgi:hypothetical protein